MHGWLRDVDLPSARAVDPMFTTGLSLGEGPPLIQDGDPRVLTLAADETGLAGWQAWREPTLGAPYLWVASSQRRPVAWCLVSSAGSPLETPTVSGQSATGSTTRCNAQAGSTANTGRDIADCTALVTVGSWSESPILIRMIWQQH